MADQESTAINDLIYRAQARRIEGESETTLPEVSGARPPDAPIPSRAASGTKPPPWTQSPHAPKEQSHAPIAAPAVSSTSYWIARELVSSATRAGGLAMIAMIALAIGICVALDGRERSEPTGPTERDRAIAIMTGESPPPDPIVIHSPSPREPRVEANEATAREPTSETPASRAGAEPTLGESSGARASPVESTPAAAAPVPGTPAAGVTARPMNESRPAAADEVVSLDDIELEPTNARPSKRAPRFDRAHRAERVAVASNAVARPTPRRATSDPVRAILGAKPSKRGPSNDPVLALLAEPPAKAVKALKHPNKPQPEKPVPKVTVGPATEIAAPKGAPSTKGTGRVTITSNVAALIFLDGRATGKTAPVALVVPAGDHQITLLEPRSKKAKTASVQIAANKTASVRRDFN